jgi:hypothetical protein
LLCTFNLRNSLRLITSSHLHTLCWVIACFVILDSSHFIVVVLCCVVPCFISLGEPPWIHSGWINTRTIPFSSVSVRTILSFLCKRWLVILETQVGIEEFTKVFESSILCSFWLLGKCSAHLGYLYSLITQSNKSSNKRKITTTDKNNLNSY